MLPWLIGVSMSDFERLERHRPITTSTMEPTAQPRMMYKMTSPALLFFLVGCGVWLLGSGGGVQSTLYHVKDFLMNSFWTAEQAAQNSPVMR